MTCEEEEGFHHLPVLGLWQQTLGPFGAASSRAGTRLQTNLTQVNMME